MTSDAISSRVVIDSAQVPQVHHLGGHYRIRAAVVAEVELTDERDGARSIVYTAATPRFVIIPPGHYGLSIRSVTDPAVTVEMQRMTLADRAMFWACKALDVIRQGPAGAWRAIRAMASRRRPGIVGMALGESGSPHAPLRLERPVLEPVEVPTAMRAVSVVIPTRDNMEMLRACLESLNDVAGVSLEIIVVNNGATRPEARAYLDVIAGRPDVTVLPMDIPFNFSRLCNAGAHAAAHPVLLFLNDDIEAQDRNWLARMLGFLARPDTGVVGARLLYPSGDLQHAGVAANLVPGPGHPWRGQHRETWETNPYVTSAGEVDAVTAACLLVRADLFAAARGFDEDVFAITVNDVDLCLRIRAMGYRIIYAPEATLIHKEGQSREADDSPAQAERRAAELREFTRRHPDAARRSVFYPTHLRRDTDRGLPIVCGGEAAI